MGPSGPLAVLKFRVEGTADRVSLSRLFSFFPSETFPFFLVDMFFALLFNFFSFLFISFFPYLEESCLLSLSLLPSLLPSIFTLFPI